MSSNLDPETKFYALLFRTAAIILLLIILSVAIVGSIEVYKTNAQIKQQEAQNQQILDKLESLNEQQKLSVDELQKNIACVVVFFSKPDRTNLTIQDINTCTIVNTNTGQTNVLPLPTPSNASNNNRPANSANSTNTPSGTTHTQPSPAPKQNLLNRLLNKIGI